MFDVASSNTKCTAEIDGQDGDDVAVRSVREESGQLSPSATAPRRGRSASSSSALTCAVRDVCSACRAPSSFSYCCRSKFSTSTSVGALVNRWPFSEAVIPAWSTPSIRSTAAVARRFISSETRSGVSTVMSRVRRSASMRWRARVRRNAAVRSGPRPRLLDVIACFPFAWGRGPTGVTWTDLSVSAARATGWRGVVLWVHYREVRCEFSVRRARAGRCAR